jgi:hypothetical protein
VNLPTIEMDRSTARTAFLAYRKEVRQRHSAEDEALMRGYRALANGTGVLSLKAAIIRGGFDEQHRPKLAIARADENWVRLYNRYRGGLGFCGERIVGEWNHTHHAESRCAWVQDVVPADAQGFRFDVPGASAMVPLIPPQYRPAADLSNYHLLWEAEWRNAPPRDPALLKYLGGELYAVLAVWDLTELERLVLGASRMEGRA